MRRYWLPLIISLLVVMGAGLPIWLTLANAESPQAPDSLQIIGHVRMFNENGPGVPGIAIYWSLAGYPSELAATTDQNGYYASGIRYIPVRETITVDAQGGKFFYQPMHYVWVHEGYPIGYSVDELNFIAIPNPLYRIYLPVVVTAGD